MQVESIYTPGYQGYVYLMDTGAYSMVFHKPNGLNKP